MYIIAIIALVLINFIYKYIMLMCVNVNVQILLGRLEIQNR